MEWGSSWQLGADSLRPIYPQKTYFKFVFDFFLKNAEVFKMSLILSRYNVSSGYLQSWRKYRHSVLKQECLSSTDSLTFM